MSDPLPGWPTFAVEIAPGGSPLDASPTWVDITRFVDFSNLSCRRGATQQNEQAAAGTFTFRCHNDDRRFDPTNTASPYAAATTYLDLTGASGSTASTADTGVLDIVGDLDVRARVGLDTTPPAATATVVGKWNTGANQRSYVQIVQTDGNLNLLTSTTGSNLISHPSTVALTGGVRWVRSTIDVDNGAAGHTVTHYVSDDETDDHTAVSWTQLGPAIVTGGTTSIFSGSAALIVGAQDAGTLFRATGRVYAAAVLSGIGGTVVADPVFAGETAGTSSFSDAAGRSWTVDSPASIASNDAQLLPRMPVRLRATYGGTTYDVWRGHVSAIDQEYSDLDAHMTVFDCTDLFGVMATVPLSQRSAFSSAVDALLPLAWWRFNETTGAATLDGSTAVDQTGLFDGEYDGGGLPAGALIDDAEAASVVTAGGRIELPALGSLDEFTLVMWIGGGPAATGREIIQLDGSTSDLTVTVLGADSGASQGLITVDTDPASGTMVSSGRVDDGDAHMLTVSISAAGLGGLFVDGLQDDADTGFAIGDIDGISVGGPYTVADLVVTPDAVSPSNVAVLYAAGADSWEGDLTGERVARVTVLAGIPEELRDLDAGLSEVLPWSGGSSVLDAAQEASLTEQGTLVVSGAGVLLFRDRHDQFNATPAAAFSDSTGVGYASHDHELAESQIVNRATFTSEAGEVTIQDRDSILQYGVHGLSRSTIDADLLNLQYGARWMVQQSKDPRQRIVALEVDPDYSKTDLWPLVLGLDINDRISFTRTPSTGSPISDDLNIIGIAHSVVLADTTPWRTTFMVAEADETEYFTIGDTTYGEIDGPYVLALF